MKQGMSFGLLLSLACVLASARVSAATTSETNDIQLLKRTSRAFNQVAKRAIPAVVFISVEKHITAGGGGGSFNDPYGFFGDEYFERFYGRRRAPQRYVQTGQGSGFIVRKDGYILTNNHVVGDADKIVVKLHDGREFEAERVGTDPRSEVAVIRIKGTDFPTLEIGDATTLEIGDWAIAVGNPFGLAESLTVGVVSAMGRSNIGIAEYEDFIQTDAAINPGNSGGPLLDINGRAIGVNTAIFSQSGGYMGIGFAIPINLAVSVMQQFIANKGKLVRGYLGVTFQRAEAGGGQVGRAAPQPGVKVDGVASRSPAADAGVKPGDIIRKINNQDVTNDGALRRIIAYMPPGSRVRLDVQRGNQAIEKTVTVGVYPEDREASEIANELLDKLGITVADLTPEVAKRLGFTDDRGVLVVGLGADSPLKESGLARDCLILSVNRQPVYTVAELQVALAQALGGNGILLKVTNRQHVWFIPIRLD